jgi:hypothetical protein
MGNANIFLSEMSSVLSSEEKTSFLEMADRFQI